jgi:hypothetical protein
MIEAIEEAGRTMDGIATTRSVGTLVKELVGEKVEQEAQRVKASIVTLGRAEIGESQQPLPRDATQSSILIARQQRNSDHSGPRSEHSSPGMPLLPPPEPRRNTGIYVALALLLAALTGASVMVWMSTQQAARDREMAQRASVEAREARLEREAAERERRDAALAARTAQAQPQTNAPGTQTAPSAPAEESTGGGRRSGGRRDPGAAQDMRPPETTSTMSQPATQATPEMAPEMAAPARNNDDDVIFNPYRQN